MSFRLDTREFQQAIAQYSDATGKSNAESLNRAARNFAIKCISSTKKSKGAAAIRALQNTDWWPKVIAKIVSHQAGKSAGSKALQAQWANRKRQEGIKSGKHKKAFMLDAEERSYVKYAKQISNQVLRSRTAAITFLRFFFRVLAAKMTGISKGAAIPSGKNFTGFSPTVRPATDKKLSVALSNSYAFKRRGTKSASGAEKELSRAMAAALPATVDDITQYASKQLAKRARQYSGKGSK